ncbi:TetR/AcrR family transcriptional regulator [Rheinheimera oceanensis]|uniref:TetR/AcrR family transcriptional regulator n=1 Tax=Rheinheimera oceanensis TaxID=2817449 RepID=UPI001BFEACCB|nr:TetR/AcrR family transcriptional regulator [Rheinheimera oceanensis]
MSKKSQITTTQILSAALNVAADQGAGKVTLDAVAKVSGLSKGGCYITFLLKKR